MTVALTSVLEMRPTTGSNDNGGFYKSDAGTTDYSQQDAAEATFTNLSTDVAGTQVTDDDGGGNKTAQMVGNGYKIGSDWYEIIAFIDSNNVTIDRSAGSSQSGLSGKIGGAVAYPLDIMMEHFGGGRTVYMKAGTAVLTENIDISTHGSLTKHSVIIGYKDTRGDNPGGADMPLISCGAYTFHFPRYWNYHNIRVTGTAAMVMDIDYESIIDNCSFINTSGTANRYAVYLQSTTLQSSHIKRSYAESTNGIGIGMEMDTKVSRCVVKDCGVTGIDQTAASGTSIMNSIITNCDTGIKVSSRYCTAIEGCTIYNCATHGLNLSNTRTLSVRNNIIDSCGVGIYSSNSTPKNTSLVDFNNFKNNTTDRVNFDVGPNDTALDPAFKDAANDDFRVGSDMNTVITFPGGGTPEVYRKGAVQGISGGVTDGGWGM